MSTPTTVKFQIAVSSTAGSGEATEKVYTLTLSLLVEGSVEGDGIRVTPILASESDPDTTVQAPGDSPLQPPGDAPLPKDPPVH
ncbi:MAG: hypothetical protein ACLGI9_09755 [Thermoanaerobaculia bacterium]